MDSYDTKRWRTVAERMKVVGDQARPGKWAFNGYSTVFSAPDMKVDDDWWTDERLNDGHDYDSREGVTCVPCGPRYKEGEEGNEDGRVWGCVHAEEAAEVGECVVAYVPASYGDTATGVNQKTAQHIEKWSPTTTGEVAELLVMIADLADSENANNSFLQPLFEHAKILCDKYEE